jgi:hypothetical protein
MNIRTKVVWLALLASTAAAWAQSESVLTIVQVSKADSPVTVTGRVTAKDQPSEVLRYSFEGDIEMTNISGRTILLMIIDLNIVSPLPVNLDYLEEDDYYFEPKMLEPGSIAELQRRLGRFGEPSRKEDFTNEVKPSARAKALFVQFSDGSTWGDAAAAKRLLTNRQLSLKQLEILKDDYQKRSEEEFSTELLKPTLLQSILSLQELYRKKQGLAPVLARLDDMLENARGHLTP